ncbi:MAG: hypothetical protein H7Y38_08310 [Armatimonadetes bacterium]|nr:hypothetical protein [Armatimonadota bacterium]
MSKAYEEFIDFLVAEATPEKVVAFAPSEQTRARVWELVAREKNEGLTADEKTELDHFAHLEHIFRVAKARAYERLHARESVSK